MKVRLVSRYRTPGELISAKLEERGWTQQTLAVVLGMSKAAINKVITGKQPIDALLAVKMEQVLGVSAEELLDYQKVQDLAHAHLVARSGAAERKKRARVFGELPTAEMIRRGWLDVPLGYDVEDVESALKRFFGVRKISDIGVVDHAYAAKRTNVEGETTPLQWAWLCRVRQVASTMRVPVHSHRALERALGSLEALRVSAEDVSEAPSILADAGVRFVVVESLKGAKIDGVCTWLDDDSPVIGMSMRYDRIDNFWFVLRHEVEHVLRGHGRDAPLIDVELEGERAGSGGGVAEEERVANEAAAEFCAPQGALDRFLAQRPLLSERDVLTFAERHGVHPGLVVGQVHRRTGRYDRFRRHLVKVRSDVAMGAVVDGWGIVAPVRREGMWFA